jgi:phage terminase large subunit-like protein
MPRGGEKFGAWWDERAAQKACDFFPRYLRHTEGEWAGRPFHLGPWQRDKIVRPVFGWKRLDGSRLIRIVWLEVPRKNGKTELAAGVSLVAMLGDGEIGGQGYSLATNKKQAEIVFNKAGTMIGLSDPLRSRLEVLKTSIYIPQLMASFKPLSAGPAGKHGLSTSLAVGDEVHEWPNGDLADVVHKSTAARRQPLEFYLTTAGIAGAGYAWDMHELAVQIIEGEVIDPTTLAIIFAASEGADFREEATWREANPNYGVSVKPEYMEAEAKKAARSPAAENDFKRYHLNIWTEQAKRWLPMEEQGWKGCTAEPGNRTLWQSLRERLRGRRCWGAIDLAITQDVTSLCLCFPPEGDEMRWTFLWWFWLPEATVEEQPLARRRRYEAFVEAGLLVLTPGNVTDYAFLEQEILRIDEEFDLQWLGIDPYNAADLSVRLKDQHGMPIEFVRQGYLTMSPPSKNFERLVMGCLIEHGNNAMATWMARNAAVEKDPAGNIKPTKARAADKIDGIVAAIMAYAGATMTTRTEDASVYETRGLLVLG